MNSTHVPRKLSTRIKPHAMACNYWHLRCTMVGPCSSYSPFVIHICWNVDSDETTEPPIHTEYLRSGGATTFTFIVAGASAVISLVMRSPIPGNMVVPPDKMVLAYMSRRTSMSHFWMESNVFWWIPPSSFPIIDGWKRLTDP